MAAATVPRKTVSIYDYPEHLNPFREEDNHNKIRFWTIGRKLNRSNSITFSGIKDLKNSWAFRSFMRKGKKDQQPATQDKKPNELNGDSSPVVYRRALQYSSGSNGTGARSTVGSPERADRYVYGGSVTPLPRSRFQERLRATSHNEVNSFSGTPRMARSEVMGSRLSVGSTNPFDEDTPTAPVRARRKKKRAPPPPSPLAGNDNTVNSAGSELQITETSVETNTSKDVETELEDMSFNIELKIVEDEDLTKTTNVTEPESDISKRLNNNHSNVETNTVQVTTESVKENGDDASLEINENTRKTAGSEEDILSKVSFPKVDIVKYRRNSSVNEDDIRLRRGNLEDFQSLSNKRSKSLTNALDDSYLVYDINLNEEKQEIDRNGNDEPQKVVCKLYGDLARKQSIDTVSSTEKEFMEIDRATRELEREISKLNSALNDDDDVMTGGRLSVSDIRRRFDRTDTNSPNPIPKPRRSHYGTPVNGNIPA